MTDATDTYVLLRAFVDELVRCGMPAACTCPGSRCAPLVLSLAGDPRLRCYSHVDERCAGFFALGLAKASGRPVAVACTSGTAAAELLAAAVEAHEARVPLLLLTADRPPELRENGAGQAIDQLKLFGGAAKWFFEVAPLGGSEAQQQRWMRTLACRAYWTAIEGRPGAVHLNFPLREPLVLGGELPEDAGGRPAGRPFVKRTPAAPASDTEMAELRAAVRGARRGVLVAGRHERDTALGEAAVEFAQAHGWPLLADPLSGARRGQAAIAHYDALLRDASFRAGIEPDVVLRVGDLPVSKPLREWLAALDGAKQVALDLEAAWQDPASVLCESFALEPSAGLRGLARSVAPRRGNGPADENGEWLASWRRADALAAEAIVGVLGDGQLSEPLVARELGVLLPAEATLVVASSMPVRDVETFWPAREDPPRVLCNRGANGIDGTVSTAFGVAAHERGPVVLLTGDVALAHDIGGLLAAGRLELKLTIVLLDNGGGGIFDFLPVADAPMARAPDAQPGPRQAADGQQQAGLAAALDVYTRHVATPTGLDFARAAALYGLAHERPRDVARFRIALEQAFEQERSSIIEVRGDRAANVALHRRAWAAVQDAISPPAGAAAPGA